MKHNDDRIDEISKAVVHFFPEALFELFAPVEPVVDLTWSEWTPQGPDLLASASNPARLRMNIRRLDEQVAPARLSPAAAYACELAECAQIWAFEVQSQARKAPLWRASTCLARLLQAAYPVLPSTDVEIRAIELRVHDAAQGTGAGQTEHRRSPSTLLPRMHVERPARQHEGLARFEPSTALMTLDPNDRRFSHPWYWPFVCLSVRVCAEQIVDRHARLLALETVYRTPFTEVRLLLGLVGRVRFPNDERFPVMTEVVMNDVTSHTALRLGHMSERERRQFLMGPTEREALLVEQRLKGARETGEAEDQQVSQRDRMLRTSRVLLSPFLSTSELDETLARLSELPTVEAIDAALATMMDDARGS